jgi:hypothetical protein
MKKLLTMCIILFLLISGFGAFAFSNGIHNVKMMLSFSQVLINENGTFVRAEMDGTNSTLMKYNHYIVPTRIETFTFPLGTEIKGITCIPRNIHRERITKELLVAPEPVLLKNPIGKKNVTTDVQPIASTGWYDYDIGTGIKGDERKVFVKIQVYPIQYKPFEDTFEWTEQIDINIQFEEPEQSMTFANKYDFVILSPKEYADELEDFVIHKNDRGVITKLVTLDEVYTGTYFPVDGRDGPEKIKFFIKHAIEQWGIHSILFVGGYQGIPTRTVQPQNSFVSDLYYADIFDSNGSFCSWDSDGDGTFGEYDEDMVDFFPDVYLGRLACINEEQVITCVHKLINFELNKGYSQEWFERFVVVAGDDFPDQGICEGESATQVALDIMYDFIPDAIWASNGRLSGTSPSGVDEITAAINKGCGFFYFSGHSSPTSFFTFAPHNRNKKLPTPTGYYSIAHISELTNGEKLPIVVFDSCSPCMFNPFDNCIGWTCISTKEGGGIGFFGATTTSLCYLGDDFTKGLAIKLALNVFDVYKNTEVSTLGEVWKNAIVQYIYPNMTVSDYITLEQWEPFIDPTLLLNECSLAPEKPQKPEGPVSGNKGKEYDYSSLTTDPDGDMLYYLFDWGEKNNSGWLGPYNSGEKCVASHSWSNQGTYEIRVKARDVHGRESNWSDPLSLHITKTRYLFFPLSLRQKIMVILRCYLLDLANHHKVEGVGEKTHVE